MRRKKSDARSLGIHQSSLLLLNDSSFLDPSVFLSAFTWVALWQCSALCRGRRGAGEEQVRRITRIDKRGAPQVLQLHLCTRGQRASCSLKRIEEERQQSANPALFEGERPGVRRRFWAVSNREDGAAQVVGAKDWLIEALAAQE